MTRMKTGSPPWTIRGEKRGSVAGSVIAAAPAGLGSGSPESGDAGFGPLRNAPRTIASCNAPATPGANCSRSIVAGAGIRTATTVGFDDTAAGPSEEVTCATLVTWSPCAGVAAVAEAAVAPRSPAHMALARPIEPHPATDVNPTVR